MSDPLAPYAEQNHAIPATSLLPDDRRSFRFKLTWTSKSESKRAAVDTPASTTPQPAEGK